jgi:PIN domain nuclease of toxin-antitoxin system
MASIVADTHALIWYIMHSEKLSPKALSALRQAANHEDSSIYLSAISIVEIGYLVEKYRLPELVWTRPNEAINDNDTGIIVVPVDSEIGFAIRRIDRASVPDMPDRIIAATALHLNLPLISRDEKILKLTEIETIW